MSRLMLNFNKYFFCISSDSHMIIYLYYFNVNYSDWYLKVKLNIPGKNFTWS